MSNSRRQPNTGLFCFVLKKKNVKMLQRDAHHRFSSCKVETLKGYTKWKLGDVNRAGQRGGVAVAYARHTTSSVFSSLCDKIGDHTDFELESFFEVIVIEKKGEAIRKTLSLRLLSLRL